MKRFGMLAALTVIAALAAAPAAARTSFVLDGAGMFSSATVTALNSRLGNFNAQTGKEVVVETVPSLTGATLQAAAEREFAQQQVNGVLIFIAKDDRRDIIVPDHAGVQAGWFNPETLRSIRQGMEAQFKDSDFDGGITTAVSGVLGIYRSHMTSLQGNGAAAPVTRSYGSRASTFHLNGFWLIVILIAAFLVLRSLMRAMSAPRMVGPPTAGAPGAPPGPGYGPGYYGGGGSGFWSGLLGGLGGAWLGNEMFRGQGGQGGQGGASAGGWGGADAGAAGGGAQDAGGWSSDAGQADVGGSSGGDFGGGGFGGGDSGGGGDFGGGGGDSGGGW